MICDPRDGCGARCLGCGQTWCRENEVSPGEAEGLCADCYEEEDTA